MSTTAPEVRLFFQHMPPHASAVAQRGDAIVRALSRRLGNSRMVVCTSTTNTRLAASVRTLRAGPMVDNDGGVVRRIAGELTLGWQAASALLRGAGPGDLYVVSSPSFLAALIVCWRVRRRGLRYVLDLRDVYPQAYAEAGLMRRESRLYRFFALRSERMYAGAVRVLAATRGLAREVALSSPGASVDCVYNGFPAALLGRGASKHARFTVCFHGVLGYFQDVPTLIEVARALSSHDVDVVVVGYGRREQALADCGLGNLRFLGRLSYEETIAEVERCHVGLCLRLDDEISRDAFPVKVWEYLGLGMPSIVTPSCEAGEFLMEQGCGFQLSAGDVHAIVERVLQLAESPPALQAISAKCRAAAASFTREELGAKAAQLIDESLHARR